MLKISEAVKMRVVRKSAVVEAIENAPARSAWAKGVKNYAYDLIYDFDENANFARITERDLLSGASDWHQYSWGGCAYCYNGDICNALCAPWEKRKTQNGALPPNSREDWLDVQARALYQAAQLILQTITELAQK